MGLFSKMKDAANQQQQGAAFGMGGGAQGAMAYAALAQKLAAQGVQANAVVSAVRPTGNVDFGGSPEIDFDMTITGPNGQSWPATVRQAMHQAQQNVIQPGMTVTVRYDPDNPTAAMIYSW